ncbi:MAG: hypothetical protein ACRCYO_13335, partial [Bacteroidia bacterium]
CTFLLINEASGFIPSNVILTGSNTPFQPAQNGGNIDANEEASIKGTITHKQPNQNNTGSGSIQTKGQNNYVNTTAKNVEIYGDNNKVWSDASNIKIQGSGNTIDGGVKNVNLINTNNQFISDSDVTYIDGKKQNSWVERSTPFIVDDTIYGYYLNGSNQVVQARLNNSKSEFYFKCINGSNRVFIDAGIYKIDNVSSFFDLLENESIRIKWNETKQSYYIIN